MGTPLHSFDDEEGEVSDINMVPLIDIMLVLLIIFIITIPVLTQTVKVDLPRIAAAANRPDPEHITVSIDSKGEVSWNGQPVDVDALRAQLKAAANQQPQPELHLRGDRKAEYESVLQVMAAAQRAGVEKLGFITDPAGAFDPNQNSGAIVE